MRADAVYYLRSKVRFSNPFFDEVGSDYFYSFVLAVWEPTPAPTTPTLQPLVLPRVEGSDRAQLLRIRRCIRCGKYRVHRTVVSSATLVTERCRANPSSFPAGKLPSALCMSNGTVRQGSSESNRHVARQQPSSSF